MSSGVKPDAIACDASHLVDMFMPTSGTCRIAGPDIPGGSREFYVSNEFGEIELKKIISALAATVVAGAIALSAAGPAQASIVIYQDKNYKKSLGDFGRGTTYVGSKADNKASSLKVSLPAKYAVLCQFRDHKGIKTGQFKYGTPDLAGWGFDNMTSSIE